MKDFITYNTEISLSISMYVSAPCPQFSEGWSYMDPYRCWHIQWVVLQERNPELRKLKSLKVDNKNPPIAPEGDIIFFIVDSKHECCLLERETLYLQGYKQTCPLLWRERLSLSLLFVKDPLTIFIWIYFWAFYSVPLIYLFILLPIPHSPDYCSFK